MAEKLSTEQALDAMRRAYGVKTNREMLEKSLRIALGCAKFCKEMGLEPKEPTQH